MRAIRTLGTRVPGRRRRVGLVLAGLLVAVLFASFGYAYAEPAPASAPTAGPVITIKNFTFQGDLTVRPGVTVTVRNNDTVMHTLTAANGSFTTPTIQPGKSATFKAPRKVASYPITCKFHPSMTGTLVVSTKPAPSPTPTASPSPVPLVITIQNFAYQCVLTVPPDAMVTVRNADTVMHTLTAVDGSFTTPAIQPGTSATFKAPATADQYPITCNFHPFMEGTLMVGVTTTPPPTTPPPPTASHKH